MLKNFFKKKSKVSYDEIVAYSYKTPTSAKVKVWHDGKWLVAKVEKVDNKVVDDACLITQAKSELELVKIVNDVVLTYLDFPDDVKDQMPMLLFPEGFKTTKKAKEFSLQRA